MAPPPLGARCARHAGAAAVDVCQRCGGFVCGECVNIREEDVFCPECLRILERPASPRPRRAFLIALAGGPAAVGLVLLGRGSLELADKTPLLGAGTFVLFTAVAFAILLQERSARRRSDSVGGGAWYPLAWGLVALQLFSLVAGGALLAYTVLQVLKHD